MKTDLSKLTDAELLAELESRKAAPKHAKDMTEAEYRAAVTDIRRGRVPRP